MSKILIIVDVQNDFCEGGNLGISGANEEYILNINKYLATNWFNYNSIVYTRDCHPKNHCSFKENGGLWPNHCVESTFGSFLHPYLIKVNNDYMLLDNYEIFKGQDFQKEEYSGMTDKAIEIIKQMKIRYQSNVDIDIIGLAFDYCVKETALDAIKYTMKVKIIKNLTKSVFPENDIAIIKELIDKGVIVE